MDFVVVMVGAEMGMESVKSYESPEMVKIHELFTIKITGTEVIPFIQSKSIKIQFLTATVSNASLPRTSRRLTPRARLRPHQTKTNRKATTNSVGNAIVIAVVEAGRPGIWRGGIGFCVGVVKSKLNQCKNMQM